MYNAGTVTTTANSTKLIGTGTKWKDNNSRVSAEQVILIQNGATIYINSIASIQSNTEITLSFPVPASVSNAPYQILTTMVNSVSDAANKIVAMNVANVQFSDILNRWATESGTITVTLPDSTTQQLRTAKEMDKQLDGKFDKTGGTISGDVTFSKNAIKSTKGTHTLPDKSGTLMQVGDYGIGASLAQSSENYTSTTLGCGFYAMPGHTTNNPWGGNGFAYTINVRAEGYGFQIGKTTGNKSLSFRTLDNGEFSPTSVLYSTLNTTKDSNGNLKAASPIVKVFADHIELNEESEGVELEKLGTGRYKLKGVLGMNSDASWGGIHGGMVIPNGINNLPLVWGSFDVLPDGDIIIETRYRKHELNERQEAERLMTYPEFLKDELVEVDTEEGKKEKLLKVEREDYEYCDIPNGHWIDVRVNMPSNSIYNLKQAEAERLAKEEAERQAEEETEKSEEKSL
ncbi:hypothetical protein [Providencia sp. PROV236]|uniref:phage tail fiber protein n=1 Tax=Providencia sp. PROV236 TaxID=2936798 RepID=UPI0034E19A91